MGTRPFNGVERKLRAASKFGHEISIPPVLIAAAEFEPGSILEEIVQEFNGEKMILIRKSRKRR